MPNPRTSAAGWTWYTGPRDGCIEPARVDSRIPVRGTRLVVDPCIPRAWRGFNIAFRYHSARYDIVVENPQA